MRDCPVRTRVYLVEGQSLAPANRSVITEATIKTAMVNSHINSQVRECVGVAVCWMGVAVWVWLYGWIMDGRVNEWMDCLA